MKESLNIKQKIRASQSGDLTEAQLNDMLLSLARITLAKSFKGRADESGIEQSAQAWIQHLIPKLLRESTLDQVVLESSLSSSMLLYWMRGNTFLRRKGMEWLYHTHFQDLKKFTQSLAPKIQVEDFAGKAIVSFIEAILDERYTSQSPIPAFLNGIRKNLVRKHFRQKEVQVRHEPIVQSLHTYDQTPETVFLSKERKEIVKQLLDSLDEKCRLILRKWMLKFSMTEIAQEMGFKNEAVARNVKRRCFRKLLDQIEAKPELHQSLTEWK